MWSKVLQIYALSTPMIMSGAKRDLHGNVSCNFCNCVLLGCIEGTDRSPDRSRLERSVAAPTSETKLVCTEQY